jgi:hypothetical protein
LDIVFVNAMSPSGASRTTLLDAPDFFLAPLGSVVDGRAALGAGYGPGSVVSAGGISAGKMVDADGGER